MTVEDRWLNFGERVGGPTLILFVLLFGLYKLTQPVMDAGIEYMSAQTALLEDMRNDLAHTRQVVERDAAERKAELLRDLQSTVSSRFDRLEANLKTRNLTNEERK
jgi:hypothetical protein